MSDKGISVQLNRSQLVQFGYIGDVRASTALYVLQFGGGYVIRVAVRGWSIFNTFTGRYEITRE